MSNNPLLVRAAAIGVLILASSAGAQALTVTRCNQLSDGVYRPVLVVDNDGTSTVHMIGEDGLTRGVLFDPEAALQWAIQYYGADAATSSYSASCKGTPSSNGGGSVPSLGPVIVIGDDDDDDDDDDGNYDDDDDDDDGGYLQV